MIRPGERPPTIRRQGKRLFGWGITLLVVGIAVGVVFLGTPYDAPAESIEAVEADDRVVLERTNGGYVVEPATANTEAGLVFYPGARVEPSAYVESLAPLASEANVTVVIPKLPMNLAVADYGFARTGLRSDAASVARERYDEIDRWYVGGHSMGGAMACRYARTDAAAVEGLVLYASYCDRDVSDTGLSVLSVVGTADTVLTWETYEDNLANLPEGATVHELPGLNHTQFGSYRGQWGDDPSGTSYEAAHDRLNEVVIAWFETLLDG